MKSKEIGQEETQTYKKTITKIRISREFGQLKSLNPKSETKGREVEWLILCDRYTQHFAAWEWHGPYATSPSHHSFNQLNQLKHLYSLVRAQGSASSSTWISDRFLWRGYETLVGVIISFGKRLILNGNLKATLHSPTSPAEILYVHLEVGQASLQQHDVYVCQHEVYDPKSITASRYLTWTWIWFREIGMTSTPPITVLRYGYGFPINKRRS